MKFRKYLALLSCFILPLMGEEGCTPCEECDSISAYVDYLYWKGRKCNLDYAYDSTGSSTNIGRIYALDCPDNSGYRIGLMTQCPDWEFSLQYTRFHADKHNKLLSPDQDLAMTRIGSQFSNTGDRSFELVDASYEMDYRVFDVQALNLAHCQCNPCVITHFFAGVKFATLDQNFDLLYAEDLDDLCGVGEGNSVDKVFYTLNMESIGPYLGVKMKYAAKKCFDLFLEASYATLVSKEDRQFEFMTSTGGGQPFNTEIKLKDKCCRLINNSNLAIGLFYPCNFNCMNAGISFGYEMHQWYNLSDFLIYVSGDTSDEGHLDHVTDSIGIDGLFIRLSSSW